MRALALLVLAGCGAPISFTVKPDRQSVRYGDDAINHTPLEATLENTSRRPVEIIAMPEGTTRVERVVCDGRLMTPEISDVTFMVDPRVHWREHRRTLRPGERASFPFSIDTPRFDGGQFAVGFTLRAPAHCRARFIYELPRPSWRARSNEIAIDAILPPTPATPIPIPDTPPL